MATESDETHKLIHVALEVLKLGDRDTAQQLAQQAAALSPGLEAPWLILAALAAPEESLKYIHKALQINPHSQPAQSALNWALKRQPPFAVSSRPVPPQEIKPQPEPLQTSTPQTIEPEPEPSQAIPAEPEIHPEELTRETAPEPQLPQAEIAAGIPPEPEPAWEETTQEITPEPQLPQAEIAAGIPPESEPVWEETTRATTAELESYWDKPAEDLPPEPESSQAEFAQPIAPVAEPLPEPILHPLAPEPTQEPIPPVIEPELALLQEQIAETVPLQPEPPRKQIVLPTRPPVPPASPKSTARPSVPAREKKKSSLSPGLFALFTFIGLVIIVLLVGFYFFQPQITGKLARLLNPISPPQCVQPLLKIGSVQFPIKSIARAADGSIPIPARSDTAWWVDGTTVNYVFEVNPASAGAAALANIQIDDSLTITWADCTTDSYVANTIATEAPVDPSVFDQTNGGISIFIPGSATTANLLIRGVRP